MKLLKTLLASAVAVSAMPALAYEAGDIIVKAGVVNVNPKSDSGADSSPVTSTLVPGDKSELVVGDDTQLGLTLTYMVAPQVGVEVLAATPFQHQVEVEGGALDGTLSGNLLHMSRAFLEEAVDEGHASTIRGSQRAAHRIADIRV